MSVTLKLEMAPLEDKTVTSRPVEIVDAVSGKTQTIDMIKPDTTFEVEPGDYGTATPLGTVNEKGKGPPGDSFSWNVPSVAAPTLPEPEAPEVEGLPAPDVITGVNVVKVSKPSPAKPDVPKPEPPKPTPKPGPGQGSGPLPTPHPAQPNR